MDQESTRYPLSLTQERFVSMDEGDDGGPFGARYLIVSALRITGPVDPAVLQGSLDDVVERHELLRTLVVRDADPPYQQVLPPCQVPLEIRDLPAVADREMAVQELLAAAHARPISAREVPLLRALLCRFDDRDSALYLTVHRCACDGWSAQVILRDLGAFYAAKTTGTAPKLTEVRQYREFAQWQRADTGSADDDGADDDGADDDGALKYWAEKLQDARETVMPNDHGRPDRHSRPYSLHVFTIEADIMAGANALATATKGTRFIILLSAVYVLMTRITGATDLAVNAVTAGRNEVEFHNTMGMFLNVVPFRTEIGDCASFRDVVRKTRETFIDAMANELPDSVMEKAFPDFFRSREDRRMSRLVIMQPPSQSGETILPIAEAASEVDEVLLEQAETSDIASGTEWHLNAQPDGSVSGSVHFNRGEFEESTVRGWTAALRQVLAAAVRDPDQDWRQLR